MLNVNPEIHLCGMTDSARLPFIYLYVTRVQSICKSYLDISTLYSDLKSWDRRYLRHFYNIKFELNAKLNINMINQ